MTAPDLSAKRAGKEHWAGSNGPALSFARNCSVRSFSDLDKRERVDPAACWREISTGRRRHIADDAAARGYLLFKHLGR